MNGARFAALTLILLTGCATAAPPSPTVTPTLSPTASPSPTASTAPTPVPSTPAPTPPATPSPTASPVGCVASIDNATPQLNETIYLSGTGFAPNIDIMVMFVGPTETFSFGGPDDAHPAGLHTAQTGAFGPWDVTFDQADEVGDWTITPTDGECEASVEVTVSP